MNETNWDECISENSALRVSRDNKKSESLLKTSEGRIKFLEKQKINTEDADYIFEGFYTSILEILHALIINAGYKVSNHLCLGYYLRDKLKRDDLFGIFDDLRYKRNSIVYYGKGMEFETAKEAIVKAKRLIKELKTILKEESK